MSITPIHQCQCRGDEAAHPDGTFWCEAHQCRKTAHWLTLCRERDDYRAAWNSGRGPGQRDPTHAIHHEVRAARHGVGTALSRMLGRCQEFAQRQQLDDWGPACLEHMPEIVAWVQEFSLTFQDTPMDPTTIERILRIVLERVHGTSPASKESTDVRAE
jgi:hypothetical protein